MIKKTSIFLVGFILCFIFFEAKAEPQMATVPVLCEPHVIVEKTLQMQGFKSSYVNKDVVLYQGAEANLIEYTNPNTAITYGLLRFSEMSCLVYRYKGLSL